ncbi:MAG: hypothetical protein KG012_18040 [Deltaproteobacteria bacterium]|nr:hypothetical protein [Deltaproteobacteria bacterium]
MAVYATARLRLPLKMPFLRKQESIRFKYYWTPAFAGVTKWELLEVFLSLALQVKSFIAFLLTIYERPDPTIFVASSLLEFLSS